MKTVVLSIASICFIALAGASSAATIDFETGDFSSGPDKTFATMGFVFDQVESGNVSISNDCDTGAGVTSCLKLQNSNSAKITKMSHENGALFNLLSFAFDGRDGESPAIYVSSMASMAGATLFNEDLAGNTLSPSGVLSQFMNVDAIYFQAAGDGSGRVDNINVSLAAVPLPATGLMMLAGLGAFGAMKRRKI